MTRFVYMPERGSVAVEGFPSAILSYRAEEASHIVPGRYERDLIDWAQQLAPASKQFVDCGAHMGSWALVMATHFREVHAFEPQRLVFQMLCGNAALNGLTNFFAYNTGLDERPGQLTLHEPGTDRGSSSARESVISRFEREKVPVSLETIPVAPLDVFSGVLSDVGLIKIDVEGLELRVLRGAKAIILSNRPKMLIECWSHDWYRDDKHEVLRLLNELEYRVVSVSGYADMLLAEPLELS